jgi:hypothetical protein
MLLSTVRRGSSGSHRGIHVFVRGTPTDKWLCPHGRILRRGHLLQTKPTAQEKMRDGGAAPVGILAAVVIGIRGLLGME